ncbi:predicted protein [Naegleria gruberi]|uniref:Predicted protein n=1 Tax=Naegleria gruberi TaxID=5762 RepID=D2VTX3_NAEGR|nr:uncharacterized protein NAEGRDRAFT_72461 [Naegleria gruberi]EFC39732.1 predicted protein [Naegleria gruberi]|eukprot:XP_002672476.1 predicted protein [Naegleria gruberi strain NEG-M]
MTISDKDNTLHLFETLFQNRNENPILCWCKNELYGGFAYKCADAYYNFLVRFKYIGTPWWFMFFFTCYLITMTIYNTIPLVHAKNASIKKKIEQRKSREANTIRMYLTIYLEELFLTDLRPSILLLIYMESSFFFIENMICFLWNYSFMHGSLKNIQLWGCFRALAIYALGYGFSTLMVQWSHIVDLIKSNQSKKKLSKYNLILLISIYIFNAFLIIIAIVLCSILKTSVYLFALAAVAMILVPTILIVSFTTYGIVIYRRLKSYKNVNISQMRFFKFILVFNTALFFGFVLAIIFVPTFISTWDIFGMFVGVFKNFAIDSAGLLATYIITYILINENEFTKCYGIKASRILICSNLPESNPSVVSSALPSPSSARDRALSSTSTANNPSLVKPVSTNQLDNDDELKRSNTVSSLQTTTTATSSSPMVTTPTVYILDDSKNNI